MKQTSRSLLTLGLFTLLAGAVSLYAYFGVLKKDEQDSQRKERADKILPVDAASSDGGAGGTFARIELFAKGETTVLERNAHGTWRMTQPVPSAVDHVTVDGLLSQLQTAKFKELIEEDPDAAALARYGLDPPRFTVTAVVNLEGGQAQTLVLKGGTENTFDGSIYMQRQGEPAVYAAQGGVRWALEKTSYELRNKELLHVEPKEVKSIEVALPSPYTLEQDEQGEWRMVKPEQVPADSATVAAMLSALRGERAQAFLPTDSESRSRFGVESPATDVTLSLRDGNKVRLRFSAPTGEQRVRVLRESDGERVLAEVSLNAPANLDKKPTDLRDRRVLTFNQDAVARIDFRLDDGSTVRVERTVSDAGISEDWKLTWPKPGPAKRFRISSVLWGLSAIRASRFGEENPKSWDNFGIGKQSPAVTLFSSAGAELAHLTIGKVVDADENVRFVRGSRNQVLEADLTRLKELPKVPNDLLDLPELDGGP